MSTPPEVVRQQLAKTTLTAVADLLAIASEVPTPRRASTMLAAVPLVVPTYYDAAGSLAVAWYDEIREESSPTTAYAATVIGDPSTDWIEREAETFRKSLDAYDLERETQSMLDEVGRLAEKEIARGFRDSILGNTRIDTEAIGWSRVARPGACRICTMLAARGAVFRSQSSATFAAHKSCHCAARPEFRNGDHGPEASVEQYLASSKRRTQAERDRLRKYLNTHYPDSRG